MNPTPEQILNALMDAISDTNATGFHCGQCPDDVEKRIDKINECFEEFPDPTDVFVNSLKSKLGDAIHTDVDDRTIIGMAVVEDGQLVEFEEAYGYSHKIEVFVDSKPIALVYTDEVAKCDDGDLEISVETYIDKIYDDEVKKLFCSKYSDSALCNSTGAEGF